MFDPSKLELDLDNLENNENTKKEEIKKSSENNTTENIQNNTNTNNQEKDILDSLSVSDVEKFEQENKNLELGDIMDALNNSEKNKEVVNIELVESNNQVGKTQYEKNINNNSLSEDKIVYDINLNTVEDLINIVIEKEYDFATIEPNEKYAVVNFRKDKIVKESKYIKFPIYTNILLKAKSITSLTIEETQNEQEGTGELEIKDKNYKIISKVVPGNHGSKLFIKAKEIPKKALEKVKKKISIGKIFSFLGITALIAIILGAAFMGFVILKAKTVEDVKFFASLGINLNDINSFFLRAITIMFSIIIFIETIFMIMFLGKLILTKKEFKQKRIKYGIVSIFVLIITFSTGSIWMVLDKKIRSLPNWLELSYGEVQIYDNSKLISEKFKKEDSLLYTEDLQNVIGPIQLKYDLKYFAEAEQRKGNTIKKFTWEFGDGTVEETPIPENIHNFNDKKDYKVKITVSEIDINGKDLEKVVADVPNVNITYSVKINEKMTNNGGKLVGFDASSLRELGKIEWYFMDNLENPVWTGEQFKVGQPIFDEKIIGMYIKRNDKTSNVFDKVFIISNKSETKLNGEIKATQSILNDLEFEFSVDNVEKDFGNGYIEEYKWFIGGKQITKPGDVNNPVESSKVTYEFTSYKDQEIKVILKDSAGETKELSSIIKIPKRLKLTNPLVILNEGNKIENLKYEDRTYEYFIDEIGTPTEITLDARFLKPKDFQLYTLKSVKWDYNSDGDIDEVSKLGKYEVSTEGNHTITVYYEFVNRKLDTEIINMKEKIYIEGIRKEAIIDFDIKNDSNYVPIIVGFDASKSQVKNDNIIKFIWNYGDGVEEVRDAVVPGHKYTSAGDYTIKLKVITSSGKEYTKSKSLILKPKPQSVKISTSMITAPIGQGIDFGSEESEGQIVGYFWDFGDGENSTEANPTHVYKKAGTYNVKLKIDYVNRNILEDNLKITITEE